jgi:hypothetical protein
MKRRRAARSPDRHSAKRRVTLVVALCVLTLSLGAAAQSTAPRPHLSGSRLAVDVVKLRSGRILRGAVARSSADGSLTLVVSRDWLRKADPRLLATVEADEARVRPVALGQLRDRIGKELKAIPEDSGVATFLRVERKRVESLLAGGAPAESPQFVILEFTPKQIVRVTSASVERKRILAWSWHARLANVESREADDLARELRRKRIDPSQPPPDLSERLPPRMQDEREWSARMALATYALGKPLDFQGTGDVLVRTDRSKNGANIAPLAARLLGGQVDSLLKDLLGEQHSATAKPKSPNAWLEPAIREAERDKARAFRATRVDVSLERRQASVTSAFIVESPNGQWETLWTDRATEDSSQDRPAIEANIAGDPQVKAALGLLKSSGAGGEEQIRAAIRMGAATMAAQQAVNQRFTAFEERFLRRLDGPPLWWP